MTVKDEFGQFFRYCGSATGAYGTDVEVLRSEGEVVVLNGRSGQNSYTMLPRKSIAIHHA